MEGERVTALPATLRASICAHPSVNPCSPSKKKQGAPKWVQNRAGWSWEGGDGARCYSPLTLIEDRDLP